MAWAAMTNRMPARDRPGALGWRRGSQYRGSRVIPVEGRDLSSRLTQQVVRDLEIGQPINSENCSETICLIRNRACHSRKVASMVASKSIGSPGVGVKTLCATSRTLAVVDWHPGFFQIFP